MKSGIIKYLLVTFFIFSILERTGISMISLLAGDKQLTECLLEEETEDASTTAENKEAAVKEYWIIYTAWKMPEPGFLSQLFTYADDEANNHLAYFPAVPTPPPDRVV